MRNQIKESTKQLSINTKASLLNIGKVVTALCFIATLFFACGKDTSSNSFVAPIPTTTPATGSLKTDSVTNNCLPSNISGIYLAGITLNTLNYLEITVSVKKTGSYSITTPTVNGYYFSSIGTLKDSGLNTIKLYGTGTPLAAGVNTFAVNFSGTTCAINVTVAPVIIPTAFTFNCSTTMVNGNYFADSAVNSTNNISIPVSVTNVGSYSIATDSVNGIVFRTSGIFTSTGSQTITLKADGKPIAIGTFNYTIATDSTTCIKQITFSHK